MARVKRPETGVEARTVPCCKTVRRAVGRGEMPNERGDSWFSPKCIEVQRPGEPLAGRALSGLGGRTLTKPSQTPKRQRGPGSETMRDKLQRQKGNSPDPRLRSLSEG